MSKHIILTLISNTLQKEFRNKTLIFLLVFTLGIIFIVSAFFKFMFDVSEEGGQGKQMIAGLLGDPFVVFYYIINIWNGLLAAILGVNCIKSDESCSVMPQLLALPIKRFEYLLGRVAGAQIIVLGYYLLSLGLGAIIFSITLKTYSFNPSVFKSLFFSSFSILFIITASAYFSLFVSKIISLLGTFFFTAFISASNSYFMQYSFAESIKDLNIVKIIGLVFYWAFPRLGQVNNYAASILSGKEFTDNTTFVFGHFFLTFMAFFFIFSMSFKRKEI